MKFSFTNFLKQFSKATAFLSAFLSFGVLRAYAGTYIPLAPLPVLSEGNSANIAVYLSNLFKFGIGIAIAFAVVMIIYGGFEYVYSESLMGKKGGRETIENALLGLLLALSSYLILNTLDPAFTQLHFLQGVNATIPEVASPDTGEGTTLNTGTGTTNGAPNFNNINGITNGSSDTGEGTTLNTGNESGTSTNISNLGNDFKTVPNSTTGTPGTGSTIDQRIANSTTEGGSNTSLNPWCYNLRTGTKICYSTRAKCNQIRVQSKNGTNQVCYKNNIILK